MATPFDAAADDNNTTADPASEEAVPAPAPAVVIDEQRAHLRFDKMFVVRLESLLFRIHKCHHRRGLAATSANNPVAIHLDSQSHPDNCPVHWQ